MAFRRWKLIRTSAGEDHSNRTMTPRNGWRSEESLQLYSCHRWTGLHFVSQHPRRHPATACRQSLPGGFDQNLPPYLVKHVHFREPDGQVNPAGAGGVVTGRISADPGASRPDCWARRRHARTRKRPLGASPLLRGKIMDSGPPQFATGFASDHCGRRQASVTPEHRTHSVVPTTTFRAARPGLM